MQWSLAALALLAPSAYAQFNMLRFACSQLVVERIDPIVNPGVIPSPHLHQIVGGNSFNVSMDPSQHDPTKSSCTSCNFKQDKSNYWTASLFFKAANGSFHRVRHVGNGGPQGKLVNKGGLDVYYIPSGKVTAFKPGFRMIAGDAANKDSSKVRRDSICHRCWTSPNENQFVGGAPCTGSDSVDVPADVRCKMIRMTIIFPTCWDGKNLDSPNHQSHMSYSGGYGGANGGGSCPSTHPVKVPQVMYEIMYNVTEFMDKSLFPTDGTNPFTYSMANNPGGSGAANHGDYLFGWEGDSLQKAMDKNCNLNNNCPAAGLQAQTPDQYNACTKPQMSREEVDGWLKEIPMGDLGGMTKLVRG